jgi:hypothetical protein
MERGFARQRQHAPVHPELDRICRIRLTCHRGLLSGEETYRHPVSGDDQGQRRIREQPSRRRRQGVFDGNGLDRPVQDDVEWCLDVGLRHGALHLARAHHALEGAVLRDVQAEDLLLDHAARAVTEGQVTPDHRHSAVGELAHERLG